MKKIILSVIMVGCVFLMTTSVFSAGLNDFAGTWENVDQNTRGVTTLKINVSGVKVKVQAWGKCHPKDCDWGTVRAYPYASSVSSNLQSQAGAITALFKTNFSESLIVISKSGSNRLKAGVYTRFTDNSGRSNYMNAYTFQRAAASETLSEDCVNFNWRNVQAKRVNNRWKIVEGNHWIMDFGNNKNEARQALRIIKQYQFSQMCFVGRPDPSMTYFLSNGNPPSGSMPGEDCIAFNSNRIQVKKINNRWKIVEGSHWIMDFASNMAEANQTYNIIKNYGFNYTCYVGRPDPSMKYLRR